MKVEKLDIATELLNVISPSQAWESRIVPYKKENAIHFLTDHSQNGLADELEIILNASVVFENLEAKELEYLLNKYYRLNQNDRNEVKQYTKKADDFLDVLIEDAKQLKSSDIHIEAYEEEGRVRVRIDGKLIERYVIDKQQYPSLINKVKIKARLDIAEKRLPQDGRIEYNNNGHKVDIRVSVLPTLYGEKVVMRLLSNDATNIQIESLGFKPDELARYQEAIKQPNGILLISGPTGSGKTTTLYATLKILNQVDTNVVTIEDPIEYTLEGINQVQLKEDIGLDFSKALKTYLRQDPDVIMLGEIRDADTANMAIRAALTGHLVLSTIHTNSAWGTVTRLIDMGVPPFLIASTFNASVAQRLVRVLCTSCCKEVPHKPEELPKGFKAPIQLTTQFEAVGCEQCFHTGYSGRLAVYEVIPFDLELAEAIKRGDFEIKELLKQRNIKSLADNAFELLVQGVTTISEVYPILTNAS